VVEARWSSPARRPAARGAAARSAAGALVLGLLAACLAPPVSAAERPSLGERLAREGRCPTALAVLEREMRQRPADAGPALLLGACHLRLGDYGAAADAFEEARERDPDDPRTGLRLAVARYHLGEPAAADELLRAVLPELEESGEAWLYAGLVALERGRADEAVAALRRARERGGESVEPVASLQLGLALAAAGETGAARETLLAVARAHPGGAWEERARRALERVERGRRGRAWLGLRAGVEWDDNVLLRGEGTSLPEEISDEEDWRGVWSADAGVTLLETQHWSGGLTAAYQGSAHRDLDAFDLQYPAAGFWMDRALGRHSAVRLLADYGYAWVDGDPFLASARLELAFHHQWDEAGASRAFVRQVFDAYFDSSFDAPDAAPGSVAGDPCPPGVLTACGPAGLDEEAERDRDGHGLVVGLEHSPALPVPEALSAWLLAPSLTLGYRFHRFDAEGREYGYHAHEVRASARTGLPAGLEAAVFASYAYRPYDDPTTFPDEDDVEPGRRYPLPGGRRREQEVRVEVVLRRPLGEHLSVAGEWRYTRNHSTADTFDYERNVVGVFLELELGG